MGASFRLACGPVFGKLILPVWSLSDLAVNAENEFKLIKVEIGDDIEIFGDISFIFSILDKVVSVFR